MISTSNPTPPLFPIPPTPSLITKQKTVTQGGGWVGNACVRVRGAGLQVAGGVVYRNRCNIQLWKRHISPLFLNYFSYFSVCVCFLLTVVLLSLQLPPPPSFSHPPPPPTGMNEGTRFIHGKYFLFMMTDARAGIIGGVTLGHVNPLLLLLLLRLPSSSASPPLLLLFFFFSYPFPTGIFPIRKSSRAYLN